MDGGRAGDCVCFRVGGGSGVPRPASFCARLFLFFFFSPSRSRAEVRAVHKVSSSSQLSERLSMFDTSSR